MADRNKYDIPEMPEWLRPVKPGQGLTGTEPLTVLSGLGHTVDKYTGMPARAAVLSGLTGMPWSEAYDRGAPGSEIAHSLLEKFEKSGTPLRAPGQEEFPSEKPLGLVADLAIDPLLIAGAAKGASKFGKLRKGLESGKDISGAEKAINPVDLLPLELESRAAKQQKEYANLLKETNPDLYEYHFGKPSQEALNRLGMSPEQRRQVFEDVAKSEINVPSELTAKLPRPSSDTTTMRLPDVANAEIPKAAINQILSKPNTKKGTFYLDRGDLSEAIKKARDAEGEVDVEKVFQNLNVPRNLDNIKRVMADMVGHAGLKRTGLSEDEITKAGRILYPELDTIPVRKEMYDPDNLGMLHGSYKSSQGLNLAIDLNRNLKEVPVARLGVLGHEAQHYRDLLKSGSLRTSVPQSLLGASDNIDRMSAVARQNPDIDKFLTEQIRKLGYDIPPEKAFHQLDFSTKSALAPKLLPSYHEFLMQKFKNAPEKLTEAVNLGHHLEYPNLYETEKFKELLSPKPGIKVISPEDIHPKFEKIKELLSSGKKK